jgi:hypothetical protein
MRRSTPSLALLALRVTATANEFARHLIHCQLDICPEALDLADEADLAAVVYGYEFVRQQQPAERVAAEGIA